MTTLADQPASAGAPDPARTQRASAEPDLTYTAHQREGCRHLTAALLGQVRHALVVTGKPVTHLVDELAAALPGLEWSLNEKCAAETAIGLSAAGARCCLVTKHNGLSVALDPLLNAGLHTTGAAVLVVVGDDLDAAGSTSAQDSRQVAEAARLPVFEPALDGDVDAVVRDAVRTSESLGTPVIIRVTDALHESCTTPGHPTQPAAFHPEPGTRQLDRDVAHGLTKLGRVQRQRLVTLPGVQSIVDSPRYASGACAGTCETGIVAVGAASRHLNGGDQCQMVLRAGWPVPAAVVEFVDRHPTSLVVEEPGPLLERYLSEHVADRSGVTGRLTGHLPPEGALSAALVAKALVAPSPDGWQVVTRKPSAPPPLARYHTLFQAISRLERVGVFVAADVGCSVRLCYPPYSAAQVALCLGSAIAVAGGAARTGRPSVGVIGDYGVLHSGLQALMEAARFRLPLLAIVLDNGVQAQTGGQPTPVADLDRLVTACGIDRVERWPLDAFTEDETFDRLDALVRAGSPAVALVSG